MSSATRLRVFSGVMLTVPVIISAMLLADPPDGPVARSDAARQDETAAVVGPAPVVGQARVIRPDRPNMVTFPAEPARFVRLLIHRSSANQPCIDELEIFGAEMDDNLAAAKNGAKATASSCLAGYVQHAIEHLNDGQYGNAHSWIPAGSTDEWAQIEFREVTEVSKIVISRDRTGQYSDRIPVDFEVQLARNGSDWKTVSHVLGRAIASLRSGQEALATLIPPPPPPPNPNPQRAPNGTTVPNLGTAASRNEAGLQNLALQPTTRSDASSALGGHAIHQITHLNDGLIGNSHSWVAASNPAWAEVDLGDEYWICHVAFGSDSSNRYHDRAATTFSVQVATDYHSQTNASSWSTVFEQQNGPPVHTRRSFHFKPVRARWVRVAVEATNRSTVRVDEIEVFGQTHPIPQEKVGPISNSKLATVGPAFTKPEYDELLRYAILGEEHAWLKVAGHADLSGRLIPYNGRVKEYPRHAAADLLPLAPLESAPQVDGKLDDRCWNHASRGVARVAYPYSYECGPLIETAVTVGYRGGQLFLAIQTNRLLSSHLAVVSRRDGEDAGVVVVTEAGLRWNAYGANGELRDSIAVDGAFDKAMTCFEMRLPMSWFTDLETHGLRIGLGMGGKHTKSHGRPVHFVAAPLAIGQVTPCRNGVFQVRLSASKPTRISGNVPAIEKGLALAPGESKVISIRESGPIGPECELFLEDDEGAAYQLHLLRYDPLKRTLTMMADMIERFGRKGLDVSRERETIAELSKRHASLISSPGQWAAERKTLFDAHFAKRRLFFRNPELRSLQQILFVKRHAFEPSHNYSVLLDSAYRGGGGVFRLSLPHRNGGCEPREAQLTRLFDAGVGIVRNPMANFDLSKIYFGYRPAEEDYFHIVEMNGDGSEVKQLTDGPFHDYWPCPLPDGGLAFISTRCRARFLCWRPQAAVLFRMDVDGQNVRPLSFANLTEWGPSVMSDGRIIWQRSEYIDKGADFSHTLWSIRPDGTHPELVFGNDIIQPNGYANGREVPETSEFLCTLISHFGDLNGPMALVDPALGRFNPEAITSLTPEVPWPGMWPREECFRDGVPISRDCFLCSHAPRDRFALYVIDRFGNREILYLDGSLGSMCPTLFRIQTRPPVLAGEVDATSQDGEFFLADVYSGMEGHVERGTVKYLRICQEVRADLDQLEDGTYRRDHPSFQDWYATPIHKVSGPFGWPSYVAKASLGLVPVEQDGSARFTAPAGKVLYFEALDENLNELQRMRSVVQLQPGEKRSCVGCHERRSSTPPLERALALTHAPREPDLPPWGAVPFAYEDVVQPVWDRHCTGCHDASDKQKLDFTGKTDAEKVPASYRTLISQGWVHYLDFGYNSGGNEKCYPRTFGTLKSKLWGVLENGHFDVHLTSEEERRIKCWIDLNCPLWPDYQFRGDRPNSAEVATVGK